MINRKDAKTQRIRKEFLSIERDILCVTLCVLAPLR
jgi:hypothetical protein